MKYSSYIFTVSRADYVFGVVKSENVYRQITIKGKSGSSQVDCLKAVTKDHIISKCLILCSSGIDLRVGRIHTVYILCK